MVEHSPGSNHFVEGTYVMAESDLSAAVVRRLLSYNPETGHFSRNNRIIGGRLTTKGYRQLCINYVRIMQHRLAWLYVYGEWPSGQIDHINQIKTDNRIDNLRVVTNKQNAENVTMFRHNKSGRKGVRWHPRTGAWVAEIKHHKRNHHLGTYDTIIDAVAARIRAEQNLFTHAPDYSQNYACARKSLMRNRFDGGPGHQNGTHDSPV